MTAADSPRRTRAQVFRWAGAGLSALTLLAMAEGLVAYLIQHPNQAPDAWLPALRRAYVAELWTPLQAHLEGFAPDAEVTYLLRPGVETVHTSAEFETVVVGNRAGLRDDEASLEAPSIVVLGDSYAMGWGVAEAESFPARLEVALGRRVLNAAMSSFGTARQTLLLRRLDLSALEAVVVQYFYNDHLENRAYLEAGFELAVTPWDRYRAAVLDRPQARYLPLDLLRGVASRDPDAAWLASTSSRTMARACLEILDDADELAEVPIVLLAVDPWNRPVERPGPFDAAARDLLARDPGFRGLASRLQVVTVRDRLSEADFFRLDPHLRPRGHAKVAEALEEALRSSLPRLVDHPAEPPGGRRSPAS